MKNCITILLFLVAIDCFSQSPRIQLGVEGGYNISKFIFKPRYLSSSEFGFTGSSTALSLQYNFSKVFSLKTGVFFYNRVSQSSILFTDQSGSVLGELKSSTRNRMFSFPIIPTINLIDKNHKPVIYLGIGPSLDFLLNSKIVIDTVGGKLIDVNSAKGFNHRTRIGIHAVLGYSHPLSKKINLNFEFREFVSFLKFENGQKFKLNSICFIFGINYNIYFKETEKLSKGI